MVNKTLGQILQSYTTIQSLQLLKADAIAWLNNNDVDYTDWSDFQIIQHHIINCPDYGVEPVSETVNDGIHDICKNILDNYGVESGDIHPFRAIELDEIQNKLTECLEKWIISRTGSDKV